MKSLIKTVLLVGSLLWSTAADTSITQRGTAQSNTASTNFATCSLPSGIVAGDTILAFIAAYNPANNISVNAPSGYSLVAGLTGGRTIIAGAVYRRQVTGTEGSSLTITISGVATGTTSSCAIIAYTGVDSSNPVDTYSYNLSYYDPTCPSASVTTGSHIDTVVAGFLDPEYQNVVPGLPGINWTQRWLSTGSNNTTFGVDNRNVPSGTALSIQSSGFGNLHYCFALMVALQPALAATPTSTATPTPTKTSVATGTETPSPTHTPSNTPTRTPTHTLSNTPTPGHTPMPSATASPAPTPSPTATSSAYYVAPTGNDSAAGTPAAPWRTIQHAVSRLLPGQTAIVLAGTYVERVSIASSGSASAPITLQAASGADVKLLGFNLSGSYWIINGFDISTQTNDTDGYGIYITGNASYDTVRNSYIHELCHEGIYMEPSVSHISVLNNSIWRAEMAGINIDGLYDLVAGNEIWDTQQVPVNAGGIYSGCVTPSGADADGMRFFGQHHDIRSNYLHDIYYGTAVNPDPHIDCFQTWGSSAMTVDSILIERNWCRWPAASLSMDNEVSMLKGTAGAVGTVTYQNNVFADMVQGINVGVKVSALQVWNNTWDHILEEAVIFIDTSSAADQIINNIFFDVGGGGDSYACIPGANPIIEGNEFYMRGGVSPGNFCSNAPYISVNPTFVNAGDSTGVGADYHLQAESPIKESGLILPEVSNDYDGKPRPIGRGYSIGAFEE